MIGVLDYIRGFKDGIDLCKPKWKTTVPQEDVEVLCRLGNGWAKEVKRHLVWRYYRR